MQAVLDGRDSLVVMPTGGGPLLERPQRGKTPVLGDEFLERVDGHAGTTTENANQP